MNTRNRVWAVGLAAAFGHAGCSATPPQSTRGDGGGGSQSPSSGGASGSSGGLAQAGGAGGVPSSGGFSGVAGAVAGNAGTAPSAGTGGFGGSAGASGGTAGTEPTAGTGGSSSGSPSQGCGNSNPPSGDLTANVNGAQAPYVVTLPNGYAASTPVPLVFGFHGRGRTHTQFQTVDASGIQQELGSVAAMAYLKSQGGTGWEENAERALNVEFFEIVLERMLAEACIDTSRIFAVGHSSGAHFTHIIGCRFGDTIRGIGAVAGYLPEQNCVENVAAIVIHGATDNQVNNSSGRQARDFWLNRNGCTMTTSPGAVSPCVAYQGCDAGLPVEWCEHTEPTYSNTNHGWPSFASEAIAELFWNLP